MLVSIACDRSARWLEAYETADNQGCKKTTQHKLQYGNELKDPMRHYLTKSDSYSCNNAKIKGIRPMGRIAKIFLVEAVKDTEAQNDHKIVDDHVNDRSHHRSDVIKFFACRYYMYSSFIPRREMLWT